MAHRKQFSLTPEEITQTREFAAVLGVTASALGRTWIEGFLESGSDYKAPDEERLQVVIPKDIAQAAELKARTEYGVSLREIIRHEIRQIANL